MIDFEHSQPMHYWAMPAFYTQAQRKRWLDSAVNNGEYVYSLKTDGNWSRAIITQDKAILQTRGISKKTGTYGQIQDRVLWWDSVKNAFHDTTVIIGQVFLEGGVDRDVGSILRCLPQKAIARQQEKQLQWRIFDVLCYEGEDIHDKPITERMQYIEKCLLKINNPMVCSVQYHQANSELYDDLTELFARGAQGIVMYKKTSTYEPGTRTAHMTCKIKKELEQEVDAICTGLVAPQKEYKGTSKDWPYIINGQKVTKNYFFGWPAAIRCSVYRNGQLIHLCDVSGLDETTKWDLKANWSKYLYRPVKLMAMQITPEGSLRHPRICEFRDDINPSDCTYEKMMG